jgi:hypothetical protein
LYVKLEKLTWSGTAISAATKPPIPRNELFVATAVDERPMFASTIYARALAYIHLKPIKEEKS